MNRDDIIRMADENGIVIVGEAMFCFAALVAAHEREACERIAMSEASSDSLYGWPECAYVIAKAIRARGKS